MGKHLTSAQGAEGNSRTVARPDEQERDVMPNPTDKPKHGDFKPAGVELTFICTATGKRESVKPKFDAHSVHCPGCQATLRLDERTRSAFIRARRVAMAGQ